MTRRQLHVSLTNRDPLRVEVFNGAEPVTTLTAEEARVFARMLARLADRIQPEEVGQ